MKKLLLLLLTLFLLCSCAHSFAADKWDTIDKALFATMTGLMIVDCLQTRYIYQSPIHSEAFSPAKMIIDDKPERIVPMFIVDNLLLLLIANHVEPKYRKMLFSSVISFELYATMRNYNIGVKLHF
jgi:hypothetical protein